MNERTIYLIEKYLSGELNEKERKEFELLTETNPELKKEVNEQLRVKEVLRNMKMKNPEKEVWDSYWISVYNKVERGIAWIAISIGAIILLSYSAIVAIQNLLSDNTLPSIVKYGIFVLVSGFVILSVSLVREKIFKQKHDKYKEIQR